MQYPNDKRIRIETWGTKQFAIPENSIIRPHMQVDDYQILKRQTFEQMRDIMYYKFHREYFEAEKAIEKHPNTADREKAMQVHWIMDYENKWPAYVWNVDSAVIGGESNKEELRRQSDMMKDVVSEYGDRAWHIFSDEKEILAVEQRRLDRMGKPSRSEDKPELETYDPSQYARSSPSRDRGRSR